MEATVRQTSAEALLAVLAAGYIADRQKVVLQVLSEHGAQTAGQITSRHGVAGAWKRLSELKALGLVKEAYIAKDERTGKRAIVWTYTGNLPQKPAATRATLRKEKARSLASEVRFLRAENAVLKAKLARWGRPTNETRKGKDPEALIREPVLGFAPETEVK